MDKEKFEYVNKFTFKNAKVIGKHIRGRAYVLTLLVNENGRTVYPRVICRNFVSNISSIQSGMYVNGEGYVRAYTELVTDGKTKKHQYFVAEKIIASQDLMTELFGRKGKFFGKSDFNIVLSGRTKTVKSIGDYNYLTVETDVEVKGRKPSYVTVTEPENVIKPAKDDMVALVLSLSTPKVVRAGKVKYMEYLYVSDLVIV